MPIRLNPFRRQDENARPVTNGVEKPVNGTSTKPLSIDTKDPVEYKLSGKFRARPFTLSIRSTMADQMT